MTSDADDRYQILRPVGLGAMGEVFQARDLVLGRDVALKVLRDGLVEDSRMRQRFLREARALARLRHANIVGIHEVGLLGGSPFLAMEWVDGPTLETLLRRPGSRPDEILRLLEQVARGVAHAHDHGVVHRDLKPANILIAADGRARVADFGLARLTGLTTSLTATGTVLGTPDYMAPEQVRGDSEGIGPWTDVHALGAILYEALTGTTPYAGATTHERIARILAGAPVAPSSLRAGIAPELEAIALVAIAPDRAARYPTARAMADDLASYLEGAPVEASRRRRRPRRSSRSTGPGRLALVSLVAAGLVGVAIAVGSVGRGEPEASPVPAIGAGPEAIDRTGVVAGIERARQVIDRAEASRYDAGADWPAHRRAVEEALEDLDEAIGVAPDLLLGHFHKGRAWAYLGRPDEAESAWRRCLEIDPGFAVAEMHLGSLFLERTLATSLVGRGKSNRERLVLSLLVAVEHLRRARQMAAGLEDDLDRDVVEASLAYADGNREELRRIADRVLATYGPRRGVERVLMLSSRRIDDPVERKAAIEQILAIRPASPLALFFRADHHWREGDLERARADLEAAIAFDGRFVAAWANLGYLRHLAGDPEGALEALDRAIELGPRFGPAHAVRGLCLLEMGRFAASVADLERAVTLEPDWPADWGALGDARLSLGDPEGALRAVDQMIATDAGSAVGHDLRGRTLRQLGRRDEALAAFATALGIDPARYRTAFDRAMLLKAGGDLAGAIETMTAFLNHRPDRAEAWYERGAFRIQAGDRRGVEDIDRAIGLSPQDGTYRHNRAIARMDAGDLGGALEDAVLAARLDPSQAMHHALAAELLERAGRRDEARAAYERALEVAPPDWSLRRAFEGRVARLR